MENKILNRYGNIDKNTENGKTFSALIDEVSVLSRTIADFIKSKNCTPTEIRAISEFVGNYAVGSLTDTLLITQMEMRKAEKAGNVTLKPAK